VAVGQLAAAVAPGERPAPPQEEPRTRSTIGGQPLFGKARSSRITETWHCKDYRSIRLAMEQSSEAPGGSSGKKKKGSRELEALRWPSASSPPPLAGPPAVRVGGTQRGHGSRQTAPKKGAQGARVHRGQRPGAEVAAPVPRGGQQGGQGTPGVPLQRPKQARAQKVVRKGKRVQPLCRGKPGQEGVPKVKVGKEEAEKEEEGVLEGGEERGEGEESEDDIEEVFPFRSHH